MTMKDVGIWIGRNIFYLAMKLKKTARIFLIKANFWIS